MPQAFRSPSMTRIFASYDLTYSLNVFLPMPQNGSGPVASIKASSLPGQLVCIGTQRSVKVFILRSYLLNTITTVFVIVTYRFNLNRMLYDSLLLIIKRNKLQLKSEIDICCFPACLKNNLTESILLCAHCATYLRYLWNFCCHYKLFDSHDWEYTPIMNTTDIKVLHW